MSLTTPPQSISTDSRAQQRTDVPGVYRRGNRYIAVTQFRGKRIKSSHATKAEARRAKAERQAGAAPVSRERFERYVERWLVEYQGRTARGLNPRTRQAYAWLLRTYAVPYFRGRAIGDIGRADVKQFIVHLTELPPKAAKDRSRRLRGSTVRRIMTPLKAMLAEAYELEVTRTNAGSVRVVVLEDRAAPKPKTLSREQIRDAVAAAGPRERELLLLLGDTGMRIGEALGLTWKDIVQCEGRAEAVVIRQAQAGEICDETKTPAGRRRVALVPELASALADLRARARFPADDAPVFATRNGTPHDQHNIRKAIAKAFVAAGVEWATPHTLRHSLATELIERGYDSSAVARILGHRSEAFTRRVYVHARDVPRFDDLQSVA